MHTRCLPRPIPWHSFLTSLASQRSRILALLVILSLAVVGARSPVHAGDPNAGDDPKTVEEKKPLEDGKSPQKTSASKPSPGESDEVQDQDTVDAKRADDSETSDEMDLGDDSDPEQDPEPEGDSESDPGWVIKNVTLHTQSDAGVISEGMVHVRDGMIVAVGKDVEIPDGAEIIDGQGGQLTPGLIDASGKLWMTPGSVSDTSTTAALRTVDSLNAFEREYRPVVAQGVTAVMLAPSERGRLGGSVALVAAAPLDTRFDAGIADPKPKLEPKWEEVDESKKDDAKASEKGDKSKSKDDSKSATKKDESSDKSKPSGKPSPKTARSVKPMPAAKSAEDKDSPKPAEKKDAEKKDADKKKQTAKPNDPKASKQPADKKTSTKSSATKKPKKKIVEVPFDIERPSLAFSSGKKGWVLVPDAAVAASLGISTRDGRSRDAEWKAVKKQLEDAVEYHKKWDEYRVWKANQDQLPPDQRAKPKKPVTMTMEQRRAEFMKRIAEMRARRSGVAPPKPATPPKTPAKTETEKKSADGKDADKKTSDKKEPEKVVEKPKFEPKKEILRPVIRGKLPLWMFVSDAKSLDRAKEIAEVGDCRLLLVQGGDLPASEFTSFRNAAIVGPFSRADEDTRNGWVSRLKQDDLSTAIGTFGSSSATSAGLRFELAMAVSSGAGREKVLRSATREAASIAGCGQWLGRIAPGYRADLALFAGDPLDPATMTLHTWVAGDSVYESDAPSDASVAPMQGAVLSDAARRRARDLRMPDSYHIVGNRFLNTDGKLTPGRLSVENGRFINVQFADSRKELDGQKAGGLPELDVADLVVTPGLVSAGFEVSSPVSSRVPSEPDSNYFVAANRFDPTAQEVRELIRGGVLSAALLPPSRNVAAGQVSAVRLAGADPIVDASIADSFVIASNSRTAARYPASLEGQVDFLRKRFSGVFQRDRSLIPDIIQTNLDRDAAARYEQLVAGQRLAILTASTAAEVRAGKRLVNDLGLRCTLHRPARIDALGTIEDPEKLGLIVGPLSPSGPAIVRQEWVAAARDGHPIGIAARTPDSMRQTAALMAASGLDLDRVARIVTVEGARVAGMPAGTGTLQAGQPADFVIWSDHPCLMVAECLAVMADGQRVDQEDETLMESDTL